MANRRLRCKVAIYKRDTYRYSGCGPTGFTMHYTQKQCSRAAVAYGRCKQHNPFDFPNPTLLDWHKYINTKAGSQ